jgi:hypothetical protein
MAEAVTFKPEGDTSDEAAGESSPALHDVNAPWPATAEGGTAPSAEAETTEPELSPEPDFGPPSSRISEPPPSSQLLPFRSPEQDARRARLIQVVAIVVGVLLLAVGSAAVTKWRKGNVAKSPPAAAAPAPVVTAEHAAPPPPKAEAPAVSQVVPAAAAPEAPASAAQPPPTETSPGPGPSDTGRAEPGTPPAPGPTPVAQTEPPPPATAPPPASAAPPDDSGPLPTRIMKALESGQNGKAVQLAQQLTAQSPGSPNAWHLRGAAEQAAGRGGKASFRKCAELASADSPIGAECKALAGM